MSLYGAAATICIRLSSLLRHLQYAYVTVCAMVKVYDTWIQVSAPAPLHPIFLDLITSFYSCGYYFHINGMNLYVPIFRIYLHGLGVWLHCIYHVGKSTE